MSTRRRFRFPMLSSPLASFTMDVLWVENTSGTLVGAISGVSVGKKTATSGGITVTNERSSSSASRPSNNQRITLPNLPAQEDGSWMPPSSTTRMRLFFGTWRAWVTLKSGKRVSKTLHAKGEGSLDVLRHHKAYQTMQKERAGNRWHALGLVFCSSVGTPGNASNIRIDFNHTLDLAGLPMMRFHDLRHITNLTSLE